MNSNFQRIIIDYHLGFFTIYGLLAAFKDTIYFLFKTPLELPESEDSGSEISSEQDDLPELISDSESDIKDFDLDQYSDTEESEGPEGPEGPVGPEGPEGPEESDFEREINVISDSDQGEYILPGSKKLTINLKKRKK